MEARRIKVLDAAMDGNSSGVSTANLMHDVSLRLSSIAPTLRILSSAIGYPVISVHRPVTPPLPALVELSLFYTSWSQDNPSATKVVSSLPVFPSLRRFRIRLPLPTSSISCTLPGRTIPASSKTRSIPDSHFSPNPSYKLGLFNDKRFQNSVRRWLRQGTSRTHQSFHSAGSFLLLFSFSRPRRLGITGNSIGPQNHFQGASGGCACFFLGRNDQPNGLYGPVQK